MNNIDLQEINNILSETLRRILNKEISLKRATAIIKTASALSRNIAHYELKERIELLEALVNARR